MRMVPGCASIPTRRISRSWLAGCEVATSRAACSLPWSHRRAIASMRSCGDRCRASSARGSIFLVRCALPTQYRDRSESIGGWGPSPRIAVTRAPSWSIAGRQRRSTWLMQMGGFSVAASHQDCEPSSLEWRRLRRPCQRLGSTRSRNFQQAIPRVPSMQVCCSATAAWWSGSLRTACADSAPQKSS